MNSFCTALRMNDFFNQKEPIFKVGVIILHFQLTKVENIAKKFNFLRKILQNRKKVVPLRLERWQSGRMRRSWKPLICEGPGVRIPLFPPQRAVKKSLLFFLWRQERDSFSLLRLGKLVCAWRSECAVLLRNIRILIKNHLLKQVWHLFFN